MPRLDQLLARNFNLTRRYAQQAILHGLLRQANGDRWPQGAASAVQAPLPVLWHGKERFLYERIVVLQHKPRDVVTSREDRRHPTAYALLRDQPLFAELLAVGRLDLDATGLLLWTNDGDLVHRLTHPKRRVSRTYHVALARPCAALPDQLELRDGHMPEIDDLRALSADATHPALLTSAPTEHFASITLHAGAYHEVKRIFAALDSHVLGLCRVEHAGLSLPYDLAPGDSRLLDATQLAALGHG